MAFKMKGSPIKLGNIATKSVLEQIKSPLEHKMTSKNSGENNPYTFSHNKRHADGKMDSEHNLIKKEERKEEIEKPKKEKARDDSGIKMKSPLEQNKEKFTKTEPKAKASDVQPKPVKKSTPDPQGPTDPSEFTFAMKSPLEQKKIKEGLKKVGKFLTEGKVPSLDKLTENVKTAVSKKIEKHKPRTTETKTEGKYKPHRVKYEGTEDEITEGTIPVTTSKKTKKRKLFGGKKETKSSITKVHEEHRYKDEDKDKVDRYNPTRGGKRGPTTITHTRKKKRGGTKKKEITIDPSGKKTVTKYDKEGNVKKVKVKKGTYRHETGRRI